MKCRCGKRFKPKRVNQRHCSAPCRLAAYNASVKGTARSQKYNTSTKRRRVQAAYNRSEKGATRRDRWQYSKAGRAWRREWFAPERVTARWKARQEAQQAEREARQADLRKRMQTLAEESGVSLSEVVTNHLRTTWVGVPTQEYLTH